MSGDISRRINVGVAACSKLIDDNTIVGGKAGGHAEFDIGDRSNANDNEVRFNSATVGEMNDTAGGGDIDSANLAMQAEINSIAAMQVSDIGANFWGSDARERLIGKLANSDGTVGSARCGCDLKPDEACTDDGEVQARPEQLTKSQGIPQVANAKSARTVLINKRNGSCASSGCQQQPIVREWLPLGQLKSLRRSIDVQYICTEPQLDIRGGVPIKRVQVGLFDRD